MFAFLAAGFEFEQMRNADMENTLEKIIYNGFALSLTSHDATIRCTI